MSRKKDFKKGAASFYIVAFSTLILLIVVTSFAAIVISEMERTANDDLSQSAYDSAMAGVEDAKLAYYNYQNCKADSSADPKCGEIINTVEGTQNCNMVSDVLNRNSGDGGVIIEEKNSSGNFMQQAYTCVKLKTILKNYVSTLTSSSSMEAVRVKFANGVHAKDIEKVKISWQKNGSTGFSWNNTNSSGVIFGSSASVPPTIALAMVQTAEEFSLGDFEKTTNGQTDRGMVYLVPTNNSNLANKSNGTYKGAYKASKNEIGSDAFLKSNNKAKMNIPYVVYCSGEQDSEFYCSATIDIPKPVNGDRNDDTFVFAVLLPYGGPDTDYKLEFFCNGTCPESVGGGTGSPNTEEGTSQASLDGVQIAVDSTGRANDLYRRVEVRLMPEQNNSSSNSSSSLLIMGPLELLGDGNDPSTETLKKDLSVRCEWRSEFGGPTCE